MGEPIDIEVARNTTTPVGFQLWDTFLDKPLDITGYTATCRVSTADGQNLITTHSVNITTPSIGEYSIIFDGRTYLISGNKERVVLSYQIVADDGSNTPVTLQRGAVYLMPGIN